MVELLQDFKTVILANGSFPQQAIPLSYLINAERIICCDGAAENLLEMGLNPDYIVGDLDSISPKIREKFSAILYHNPDQETNDLTKAVQFCISHGWKELTILGATGKREDHSIGNLSLLADYMEICKVQLLTDYGTFTPQTGTVSYESYPEQQISIFSLTPTALFSAENLVYPIEKRAFTSWWQGTLNQAASDFFTIQMNEGKSLIFREYER